MRDIAQPAFDAPASNWSVYADALQEAGDPRGELIALGVAGDFVARDAYARANWGEAVGDVSPEDVEVEWHYGVMRGVTVKQSEPSSDLISRVLALPVAAELRRVELRGIGTVDLKQSMDVLARKAPVTCTQFAFVDQRATEALMLVSRDFDPPPNLVAFGSFQPFWGRAEAISIDCADASALTFGAIDAPELRSFALRCLRFADYEEVGDCGTKFAGASWPKLESFELRCVELWMANVPEEHQPYVSVYPAEQYEDRSHEGETEGVNWDELSELLGDLAKRPLRRLALTSSASTRSLLDALVEAGLPPTLRELDLSDSAFDDEEATWMLDHLASFNKLDSIILHHTPVTAAGVQQLKSIGPRIVHSPGTGATYRYVVGAE